MRRSRTVRALLTSIALVIMSLFCTLMATPASAGLREESAVDTTTPTNPTTPMVLASTGLDITVPIIIGLSLLVLGTVVVGWAFLATGRRGQHR